VCVCVCLTLAAAGAADAADLRVRQPVTKAPPPVAIYNWTGFYIGGHGGWAWTDKTWVDALSGTNHLISDNGIGGGQVGFNWQTGAWVLGVEAQASWTHIRKGWTDPNPEPIKWSKGGRTVSVASAGTTVDHFGTIAARIGYALDRGLLFAKGGGAWAHDIYRATDEDTGTPLAGARDTRWGWMAGVGYEYAFLGNWSAKVELDYLWLGTKSITYVAVSSDVTPPTRTFDVEQAIGLVKVGINYRFGPPAVVARY